MSESRENPKRTRAKMSSARIEILFFPFPMFLNSRTSNYVVIFFRDRIALFHSLYQDLLGSLLKFNGEFAPFILLYGNEAVFTIFYPYCMNILARSIIFQVFSTLWCNLIMFSVFLTTVLCGLSLDPTCE